MRARRNSRRVLASALVVLAVAGALFVLRASLLRPTTVTAYFTAATAIYPGDDVRIAGLKIGTIASIDAQGTQAKMVLKVDHGVPIPADAKAIIVAQNLVAARYVQLTPVYEDGGPMLEDGAVIPLDRTAVPVEWDEVKTELSKLATELGPQPGSSVTSTGRFINSAANAMDGNGEKLRETLRELSASARILADGSSDLVAIIKNLQIFVMAIRDSSNQIEQFQDHLASLTSVVDNSKSDLDAALTNLADAITDIKRFVAGSRDQTSEQVQRLANVTQNLVDHREDLENILHNAPNAFANAYNIYNPDTGSLIGSFAFQNFANPVQLLCAGIGAVENATAPETAKLCADYLGPALRLMNFNYLPFPVNPVLMPAPQPDHVVYSPPALSEGKSPVPAEPAPAISAYTGAGDPPLPPGWGPPPTDAGALLLPSSAGTPPPRPGQAGTPGPVSGQGVPPS